MALYTSHFSIQFPTTPAKIPTFNHLIARTSIIPLSHRRTQSLSSILTLRANPPQKYVYPDPIPEFAEAVIITAQITYFMLFLSDFIILSMYSLSSITTYVPAVTIAAVLG